MGKFKLWLIRRFLPAWSRQELLAAQDKLIADNARLRHENECLKAYQSGVLDALKAGRRISIYTGGEHYGHCVSDRKSE